MLDDEKKKELESFFLGMETQEQISKAFQELYINTLDNQNIYARAFFAWGLDAQMRMVQEELAELIVAINKFFRAENGKDNIIEEVADSTIMIEQLIYMMSIQDVDFSKKVNERKAQKIERLKGYLDKVEVQND